MEFEIPFIKNNQKNKTNKFHFTMPNKQFKKNNNILQIEYSESHIISNHILKLDTHNKK